jgi:hypothetical protein
MATVLGPEVRKFTIAKYYKLAETGILAPSERVELLDGQILPASIVDAYLPKRERQ